MDSLADRVASGTPDNRLAALVKAMAETAPDEVLVERVVGCLGDEHPGLRQAALEAIGRFAEFADVDFDVSVLERTIALAIDDSAKVRAEAACALALIWSEVDHPPRTSALLRLLKDDDDEVRQEAAAALGDLQDPSAKDALAERLDDKSEAVRFEAAFALATLKDSRGRLLLEQALGRTRLRLDAMKALGLLGDAAAIAPLERFTSGVFTTWADRLTAHATMYLLGHRPSAQAILSRTSSRNLQERTYAVALIGTHNIVEGEATARAIADDGEDILSDTAAHALEALRTAKGAAP